MISVLLLGLCAADNPAPPPPFDVEAYLAAKKQLAELPPTLDCAFEQTSVANRAPHGKASWTHVSGANKAPQIITFSALDTDKPLIVGNAGSAQLQRLQGGAVVYLVETSPSGNIVIYTYFPRSMTMAYSKQYDFAGGMPNRPDQPFVMIASGVCKAR